MNRIESHFAAGDEQPGNGVGPLEFVKAADPVTSTALAVAKAGYHAWRAVTDRAAQAYEERRYATTWVASTPPAVLATLNRTNGVQSCAELTRICTDVA